MGRKYYCDDSSAPLLTRLRNRLFRKPVPEFPKTIVIETQSGCNAGCLFCQYARIRKELPHGRMEDALFEKIIRDCAGQPVERFILCFDNEPLLDKGLAARLALVREVCPGAARNISTNASLLDEDAVETFAGSGLLTEIFLSVNGNTKETYEKAMGLPYERTFANLENFCRYLRRHPEVRKRLRVRVTAVRTELVVPELPEMKRRWEAEGFEFHVIAMDTRGGQLARENWRHGGEGRLAPNVNCRRPFHTFVATWEGKAVLCCVDYRREVVLGDLTKQSVGEIWNGPVAVRCREELLRGDFSNLPICRNCMING
ncbi:MAG: SPASM domain-containing protein [Planctomycetota bacterium]|nr:SPASM domain-containing protein [Planctomycetota bacterium]